MNLFTIIEEAHVILRSKGVYKQAKVFHRGGEMFAQHGSGFISLRFAGATSLPSVTYLDIEVPKGYRVKPSESMNWSGYKV